MNSPLQVRPLAHPGPRQARRRESVPTTTSTVYTTLPPRALLCDALAEAVDQHGVKGAQIEIMGGTLARISYCTPDTSTGEAALSYSPTREAAAPAHLITASVTLGHRDGERFAHCHAAWFDARGQLQAGHLWPATSTGPTPIHAAVHLLPDVAPRSTIDSETGMPVFTPYRAAGCPGRAVQHARRAVLSRIKPGEDLIGAASAICHESGFAAGEIRASLGSLVGARLRQGNRVTAIDGPATEVITITGTLHTTVDCGYDGELSTILVDRHGTVHAGTLVPGDNLVAATFELFIAEEEAR